METTILNKTAFLLGDSAFSWKDVVLAAIMRGDWMAVEQQAWLGVSLVASAEENDASATEEELDASAQEFRYERDLVTAEEMEAWLELRGLTVDEWMSYIERSVLRQRPLEDSTSDSEDDVIVDEDARDCILAEAICSGELTRFADVLAAHAAIALRGGEPATGTAALDPERLDLIADRAATSLDRAGLEADGSRERIAELEALEAAFEQVSRQLLTDSAVRAQIEKHRLDWIRLDVRDLGFSEETAAKEAALCLREDGATLDSVAAQAHIPVQDAHYYLDETDPEARPMLLGARPDELVGPIALSDGFHLLLIREKIMPSEQDAEIRRRAEESLLASLSEREAQNRVRWHERL